jgi:hypothetical protein
MPKLSIDTGASLYEPIEVEIDGKAFVLRRLTQKDFAELEALDQKIIDGNLVAAFKRLDVLFGPDESFSKLDIYQVGEVIRFVARAISNPEKKEKNGPNPGGESPAP